MTNKIKNYAKEIESIPQEDYKKYRDHWDSLVHPTGSLGEIEEIGIKACAILGEIPQELNKKATVVMCNDNGIINSNISSSPKILTKLLAIQMAKGTTGVDALSEAAKADVVIVDLGIEDFEDFEGVINRRISNGTKNFLEEDAMTYEQALKSIEVGIEIAEELIQKGYKVLGTGELGMGNTTTSAAVIKGLTGASEKDVVGLGSGVDKTQLENKYKAVADGIKLRNPDINDPIDVLSKVGGYDIGAIAGVFLACGKHRIPGVIDGIISSAGALLAYRLNPNIAHYLFGSHIAIEKGAKVALDEIGIKGYLNCSMRLGEGSGCPLLFQVMDSSIYCMNHMTKFEETDIVNTLVNIRDKK